ncbi:MAG: LysM peptidoglycan-binding domain-containing protein [Ardenticatenaceae bacterium]
MKQRTRFLMVVLFVSALWLGSASESKAQEVSVRGAFAAAKVTPKTKKVRAASAYTVQAGDTLSRIALDFDVTLSELMTLNNISDPRRLQIGTVLTIPGSEGATETPSPTTYTVQAGDTLFRIALDLGVTLSELMSLNNITDPRGLQVGAVLSIPGSEGSSETPTPTTYRVQAGDTLSQIALNFDVSVSELMIANNITDPRRLLINAVLLIPGRDGSTEIPTPTESELINSMTEAGKNAPAASPYHKTTWMAYYGRPNVAVMGILGEYTIDELIPRLREQANVYDEANGPELAVMPAFELVYGMATKAPGLDGDHLYFLSDAVVTEYIERAQQEGFGVILDIQIGSLSPVESLQRGLPWLRYDNVQLALDPEFAMSYPDQVRPGSPAGFVTAQEINEAQWAMRDYMNANNISGSRILLVHQFLSSMIRNKPDLANVDKIDLTTTADGWGGPRAKVEKYNIFVEENTEFTGFKLFYRWDVPLITEREALGLDRAANSDYVETTPNMIIYQ